MTHLRLANLNAEDMGDGDWIGIRLKDFSVTDPSLPALESDAGRDRPDQPVEDSIE